MNFQLPDGWEVWVPPYLINLFGVERGWRATYIKDSDVLIIYVSESTGKVVDWRYVPSAHSATKNSPHKPHE